MAPFLVLVLVLLLLQVPIGIAGKAEDELRNRLNAALVATEGLLADIFDDWQIDKYPNFLQTAAMTHTSWEVLKLKYQMRILSRAKAGYIGSNDGSGDDHKFVVSFMGSSVTAGHDSPFNATFPVLAQVCHL